jgi:5-methylcytosine-specific restriction endonuclease McrA
MKRRPFSHDSIRAYWSKTALGTRREFDASVCFACRWPTEDLERAHILPLCEGGSDEVSNLHLLCEACHKDSEFLSGRSYWKWLLSRTLEEAVLSSWARRAPNPGRLFALLLKIREGAAVERALDRVLAPKWN